MASEMFGKTYIVKVLDDGECITEGELIRCKDCKYWLKARNEEEYSACSIWFDGWGDCMDDKSENDYCSRAEREEHETD